MSADPDALARQLADEYGDLLPPTLIVATLQAAVPSGRDQGLGTAREDIDALAQASLRRQVAG